MDWESSSTFVSNNGESVIGNGIVDKLNNYAFEFHQYLDSDGSGSYNSGNDGDSTTASYTSDIASALKSVTSWAEQLRHLAVTLKNMQGQEPPRG